MNVVMRYCIEYVNPRFPFLDNGNLNVRHYRAKDEETAESVLTIILSCGCKIVELYRGNVKDGKLAEWETPMIVDQEDWVSDKRLEELRIIKESGWHPASELPPLDEDGDSETVVGIWEEQQVSPFITIPLPVVGYVSYEDGEWTKPIKWWIAPPKEE